MKSQRHYLMKTSEVLDSLGTKMSGLPSSEAQERLKRYGFNEIEEKKRKSALRMLLDQFANVLIIILIIATIVSAMLGEIIDAAVILIIVVLNAALGFYQERKAEHALNALKKMAAPKAEVMRNGSAVVVPSREIVPGDILRLKVGDRVPADCRIIEQMNLKADESMLTGESLPIEKISDVLSTKTEQDVPIAERRNMLFSGTNIVYGHCTAVVISTADQTEFGKIAKMLEVAEEETPLQKRLSVLGRQLGIIILIIAVMVFAAGFLRGESLILMFLTAVALAVAAIPEGLPAVITITLAIGLQRMAKRNAIMRRLAAVETLGSTTVICSDKTGTLTVNEMTVRKLWVDNRAIDVTGEGYAEQGLFVENGKAITADEGLHLLLGTGMLCNDAVMQDEGKYLGDPTEIALLVSAKKAGMQDAREKYKRIGEIPFDSNRKMMSVACMVGDRKIIYTKGAVEEVLSRCNSIYTKGGIRSLSQEEKRKILDVNRKFANNALRVLALSCKKISPKDKISENDMMFIGLQCMIDPPRPEVKEAVALCKKAGIKVVMITGDHKDTAIAVGRELGIIEADSSSGRFVVTGVELDSITKTEFQKVVEEISIYARVSPEHKVRITDALKLNNHVVAMTGDGVNDAPALKRSDIGIAMGITGTDVTKEASDMVLADDNFSSIVSAVEEGRVIYDNIKKAVHYLLSCNVGEVAVIFTSILINLPLPILPIQILWMNLLSDGPPTLALAVEPKDSGIMERKPRNPKEKILGRQSFSIIILGAIIMAIGTMSVFYYSLVSRGWQYGMPLHVEGQLPEYYLYALTMSFTTLIMFQKFLAISFRSEQPIHKVGIFSNKKMILALVLTFSLQLAIIYIPYFNPIFKTVPLSLADWALIIGISITATIAYEIQKIRKKQS
ncbi:MAG: cation-translocating P-type ATPase [Candidatus Aenigmarchaeota archaeon]|nr:cation-translocating P-type ATPase [Candidatus Aenigmarchaeota archaeon]